MTNNEILALAQEYIDAGVPVFPIELRREGDSIKKVPLTPNGHKDATLDIAQFAKFLMNARHAEAKGVGGVPGAAGFVVLDYDVKHGGRGGLMLERHRAEYGDEADAVSYRSVSGAINVFHRKRNDEVAISNTSAWPDVDIRSDNGWVVLPGTSTPWGSWEWRSGELADAAPMPPEMWDKMTPVGDVASMPTDMPGCYQWLAESGTKFDPVSRMQLNAWLNEIATTADRNGTLFRCLTELRRIEPQYVDRTAWFEAVNVAWQQRMRADGALGRLNEPDSVLTRVVGHAHALAEIDTDNATVQEVAEDPVPSFRSVDLGPYLDGELIEILPDLLVMDDGRGLLYRDRVNVIHGASGAGKSWIIALTIKQEAAAGRRVCVIDLEDDARPLIQRLQQIRMTADQIKSSVVFIHPEDAFAPNAVDAIVEQVNEADVDHIFIDSWGEALGTEGFDENNDSEVTLWTARVIRNIINRTEAGITMIDHTTKAGDNVLYPAGSKRKRATVTGVNWLLYAITPLSKKDGGRTRFKCAKDRHGNYRSNDDIGDFIMTMTGPMCTVELWAKEQAEADDTKPVEMTNEQKVVHACEKFRTPMTKDAVGAALSDMEIGIRRPDLVGALELAAERGFLELCPGRRKGDVTYRYLSPWTPMEGAEYVARGEPK